MEHLFTNTFWTDLGAKSKSWIINELPGFLLILVLFFLAFRLVGFAFKRLKKRLEERAELNPNLDAEESLKRVKTLTAISQNLTRAILWIVFIMMALQKLGINIAPILASAGIVGLAIGFGAQELVRDIISGFFILFENQIRAGDVAIINGITGMVEKIELRTITLRDINGTVHVFQNGKINDLANMTKDWSAMVFDIGVAYKENTDEVMKLMKEVGDEMQKDPTFSGQILEPLEVMGLDQFGDSAIVIRARFKTKPNQQWEIGREYRKRLKVIFDQKNIEIPFPHTTLTWAEPIDALKLDIKK